MKKSLSVFGRHREAIASGIKAGTPIGLGYLAVAFSLGIVAKNSGLNVFQGFLAGMLNNASAGEYAGFTVIAADAAYTEMIFVSFIANARYILMSCAMGQRIAPGTRWYHRFLLGFYATDELFGIAIARPGYIDPFYTYGAVLIAAPCWAGGTVLGILAGDVLPIQVISAFSVALYGMFLAVIIPPCRHSKVITGVIALSFALSYAASVLPYISGLSDGTRTIILTVVISAAAAVLFPKKAEEDSSNAT